MKSLWIATIFVVSMTALVACGGGVEPSSSDASAPSSTTDRPSAPAPSDGNGTVSHPLEPTCEGGQQACTDTLPPGYLCDAPVPAPTRCKSGVCCMGMLVDAGAPDAPPD